MLAGENWKKKKSAVTRFFKLVLPAENNAHLFFTDWSDRHPLGPWASSRAGSIFEYNFPIKKSEKRSIMMWSKQLTL